MSEILSRETLILHATTLARRVEGRWLGVLVRGPSGAGKSDLALRALDQGWRLVADDRSIVWLSEDQLYARAPATLSGLVEARGVGVLRRPRLELVRLALIADAARGPLERVAELQTEVLLGAALPRISLDLRESLAPLKLSAALAAALAQGAPTRL
jgi:serine kinase of HPr protein (carbohydrate metabolism regulator)